MSGGGAEREGDENLKQAPGSELSAQIGRASCRERVCLYV